MAINRVEGEWAYGEHLKDWTIRFQYNKKTVTISSRGHLKSTTAKAYIAWQMYRNMRRFMEWEYMSYTSDLGAYHTKGLRRYIEALPECFGGFENLSSADSIIHYRSPDGNEFYCAPTGILSAKRGRHPYGIMADDILRDPQKKLDLEQLNKIKTAFYEQVEPMPNHELHVVGTPQDETDLLNELIKDPEYDGRIYPSEDLTTGKILWPQMFPRERLDKIRSKGEKTYKKEYLCIPVRSVEGYIDRLDLERLTWRRLTNYRLGHVPKLKDYGYAGLDIGKKAHPSHFVIFKPRASGRLMQVHSKWFDGVNYTDQIEYCRRACEDFNVDVCYYDATRGEFEGFAERRELPDEFYPVTFTSKIKFAMAGELDKMVTNHSIVFLNDERQKNQMLSVDNDLRAIETEEGHGDSFWSVCLAIAAYLKGQGVLLWSI